MFKTLVVGVDGSEPSGRAVELAARLAAMDSGTVHLVHAPEPRTVAFAMGAVASYHVVAAMPTLEDVDKATESIFDRAEEAARRSGATAVQRHVADGDAASGILAVAEKLGADVIVTGRRGLGSFMSMMMGSTTLQVSHAARVPCLTVP